MGKGGWGKGGGGGGNKPKAPSGPPKPVDPATLLAAYEGVTHKLLPMVSSKIDANGGVMAVWQLEQDTEIEGLVEQLPIQGPHPKELDTVLAQWTDFFVALPNKLVGTTMGYETGMIRADHTLEPSYASLFPPEPPRKRPRRDAPESLAANMGVTYTPGKVSFGAGDSDGMMALTAAAKTLFDAIETNQPETTLTQLFGTLKSARNCARQKQNCAPPSGTGIHATKAKKKSSADKDAGLDLDIPLDQMKERKNSTLLRCAELMKMGVMSVEMLQADPQVAQFSKGVIPKLDAFLGMYPTVLSVTGDVCTLLMPNLTESTIPAPTLSVYGRR